MPVFPIKINHFLICITIDFSVFSHCFLHIPAVHPPKLGPPKPKSYILESSSSRRAIDPGNFVFIPGSEF